LVDIIEAALLAQVQQKLSLRFYEEVEEEVMLVAEDIVEYQRKPKQ
jgi:hypothetical protein